MWVTIAVTVVATAVLDFFIGHLAFRKRGKRLLEKVDKVMNDSNLVKEQKIYTAKKYCRETKGSLSAGVHFGLSYLDDERI